MTDMRHIWIESIMIAKEELAELAQTLATGDAMPPEAVQLFLQLGRKLNVYEAELAKLN